MIKNTKRIFALVLAVAVVAMSMFTGLAVSAADPKANAEGTIDLLEFGDYLTEAGSASKYYDTVLADNGETGTEADPIIIDSAEEFVYLSKASGNDTIGKYYKVADGIAGFDLSNGKIDYDASLADSIDTIKAGGKNHAGNTPGFQGNFDGNGITVYGAWTNHNEGFVSNYAGLFSCTKGNVTIKNVHVNKAVFTAKNATGGIIGYHAADDMATVTIENCSVTESYLEAQGNGYGHGVGAIIGFGASAPAKREATDDVDYNGDGDKADTIYVNVVYEIKNCYVNIDENYFVSKAEDGTEDSGERACHGGVAGIIASNALAVKDCVVIGIKPYATNESTTANDVQHSGLESHFANVYTTSDVAIEGVNLGGNGALGIRNFTGKVFPLSDAQLKGAAALDNLNLDWSVWMADDEGYPELRNAHKNVKFTDNGDGTHGEVCDCGFGGISAGHVWVNSECACGAELNCAGRDTIYWDGSETAIATGTGAKDDPYIIKSASEFAWLIKNSTAANTVGKYYKIADNIGKIVLQPADLGAEVLALKSAAETQAFFESDEYVFTAWPNMGWEATAFSGVFDGNGAIVYGLYQTSSNNAGLFSTVDAGAVIKNIGVKNSYITSSATNYQVAAIAPVSSSINYGIKADGMVWIDNVIVANNYLYNSSTQNDRSGVVAGAFGDAITVDNALVYDNIALDGQNRSMPLVNTAKNAVLANGTEVIPKGLVTKTGEAAVGIVYYNMVRNSVIMGTEPYDVTQGVGSRFNDPNCYEHVYTDAYASTFFATIGEDQIKTVTLGELATLKLGAAWLNTTTYPELAAFHDADLDVTSNDNGTHGSVCSCGAAFTAPCDFVNGKCAICEAELTCASKRTLYWDGSVATGFTSTAAGTKEDPIIINTAAELAYLVSSKADVSQGKYFAMADDIGTIVLQAQDIASEVLALDSAADVQAYFENDEYVFSEWVEKGWEQACFAGSFDGKGVKIYGLYIVSETNAALFPTVDAGAAIHNVAVVNSYFYSLSTSANYQVGAIAGTASNGSYGIGAQGVIWFDGCVVGNCYMRNDATDTLRSGVIFGVASSDSVAFDNCLVYGNDAKHGGPDHPLEMALYGQAVNGLIAPAVVPEGLVVKTQEDTATGNMLYYNTVRNTITFGTNIVNTDAPRSYRRNDPGCFENNYTDGVAGEVMFNDGNTWVYDETQIKAVTLETLNDNDLGAAWIKTGSYPELAAAHMSDVNDNGDGTHSVSCPCGAVAGAAEAHNFVEGVCDVCGAECAHTPGEAVEENRVEATCKDAGSYEEVVYCTDCGAELSRETKTIETIAHTHGEPVEENRVEPTCKVEGSYDEVVYCTVCDEEVSRTTKTIEINPDAHTYDDNKDADCNDCGAVRELFTYGDVNGDGEINNRDLALLMQYLNEWDVELNLDAADVNVDGEVNNRDYALLMQFTNEWDVTIGR